ncbi:MAG TPA: hypothetical protein VII70_03235 [Steroidobacteraceae bacterium]
MTSAPDKNGRPLRIAVLLVVSVLGGFTNLVLGAESVAVVTIADADFFVIRHTTLYRATVGANLRDRDIIETRDAGAQIEMPPRTLVAVAAHSRILLRLTRETSSPCEIQVWDLQGMVKLAHKAPGARGPACLQTGLIRVMLASGSAVERANGAAVSVFAESGDLVAQYEASSGRTRESAKVPAEQFAQWRPGESARILARPEEEFLAAMPASFHDALMSMTERTAAANHELVALREVTFSDIASWLKETPAARLGLIRQFQPRLKDPEFRRELDQELGKSSEWAALLHPVRADASAPPDSGEAQR